MVLKHVVDLLPLQLVDELLGQDVVVIRIGTLEDLLVVCRVVVLVVGNHDLPVHIDILHVHSDAPKERLILHISSFQNLLLVIVVAAIGTPWVSAPDP